MASTSTSLKISCSLAPPSPLLRASRSSPPWPSSQRFTSKSSHTPKSRACSAASLDAFLARSFRSPKTFPTTTFRRSLLNSYHITIIL